MSNPTACFSLFTQTYPVPSHPKSNEESLCIGVDNGRILTNDEIYQVWQTIDCPNVFYNKMYPIGSGGVEFNQNGYNEVENDMRYLLSKYFNVGPDGHPLVIPGQAGYTQFQDLLINTCNGANGNGTNGVCTKVLPELCYACNREEIANNTNLLKLCGCFSPDLDPNTYPDIEKICDPLCSQYQVSRFRDLDTGEVLQCNSNVCVINNVSISATKSSVGQVNFTQSCPNCNPYEPCKCIVDVTIASSYEQLGLDSVNFYQYCGENSVCIVIDNTTGVSKEVPCQDNLTQITATEYHYKVGVTVWIILLILIILTVLVIYTYCNSPYNYDIPDGYRLPSNFYPKGK